MNGMDRKITLSFLPLLSFGLAATILSAQVTSDWDGTASGDWDDTANWHNTTVPGTTTSLTNSDTARIGTGGSAPPSTVVITVDADRVIQNITFRAGLDVEIAGAALGLSHGGTMQLTTDTNVISPVTFSNDLIFHPEDDESDGSYTINWNPGGSRTLTLNGDLMAGETTGTVTVTRDGARTVNFNGALLDNPNGGSLRLVINGGANRFDAAGSNFSGGLVLNGGTNRFDAFSGAVVVNGGTVNPEANNAIGTGTITWNGGTLGADSYSGRQLSNTVVLNGQMSMNRVSSYVFLGDFIVGGVDGADPHIVGGNASRTHRLDSVVDGGFDTPLRFTGDSHSLRLTNANPNWTGGLIFNGATLELQNSGALGTGTWVHNGGSYFGNGALTVPNSMEWNGNLTFSSSHNDPQTFTGNVVLGADNSLNPSVNSATNNSFTFSGVISDGGNDKPLTLNATFTPSLFLNLTGNNTFTGGIYVPDTTGVSLGVGHDNSLGTGPLVVENNSFTLRQTGSATSLNLPNAIELDASITLDSFAGWEFSGPVVLSTIDNEEVGIAFSGASNVAVFSGVVTDANNVIFVKTGAGILAFSNNSNAIDGTLQVDGGGIQIGAGGASGQLGSATIELASGASLIFNRSDAFTVANEVSGAGGLIARGGDAELTGTLTFTGNSTVEDGATLRINTTYDEGSTFNVQSGGTFGGTGTVGGTETPTIDLAGGAFLSPGGATAPGTLTLGANTNLNLSNIEGTGLGALIFRLGSVSDQVDGGFITFTDDLGFSDFNFQTVAGFTSDTTYTLFSNIFATGSLDNDNLEGMVGGFLSFIELDGSTLSLHVTAIPEPATVATILGALALGLTFWRRRARAAR